jgi:hypothetical protein
MFKYSLEKYSGAKSRHTCPSCGAPREFTRYVDAYGNYPAEKVGKCNRESKCGYHYKPKDYFQDNPEISSSKNAVLHKRKPNQKPGRFSKKVIERNKGFRSSRVAVAVSSLEKPQSFLPIELVSESICDYERNAFVQFLLHLFPDDAEAVNCAVKGYFIGTFRGKTVFWQIDQYWRVRAGKLMIYNVHTGKRIPETFTNQNGERIEIKVNWIHAELKKQGKLSGDFQLKQCYFGEHLLTENARNPIAIVESEKTAVISSICFPEFIWLASGGKQNLKVEHLKRFGHRQIVLFPDSDGFAKWCETGRQAQAQNLNVTVSTLLEDNLTAEQKKEGYDLADFLIAEQKEINSFNLYVDHYNSMVQTVLNDAGLIQELNTILDEKKALLTVDGTNSEEQAETIVTNPENLRRVVLTVGIDLPLFYKFWILHEDMIKLYK